MQTTNNTLNEEVCSLNDALEKKQQYSKRNCLLIHGIPASKNENTDEQAKLLFKNQLQLAIGDNNIDRSHRLSGLASPIIVIFACYNIKNLVYNKKKNLQERIFLSLKP